VRVKQKDFTCDKCKGVFDEICQFTPYGNPKRKEQFIKKKKYCEKCFEIIEKNL